MEAVFWSVILGTFLGTGIFISLITIRNGIRGYQSVLWPNVAGVIKQSEVVLGSGYDRSSYMARVSYKYTVQGRSYESHRVYFGDEVGLPFKWLGQKWVSKYRHDMDVKVFFHPEKPQLSTLEPGLKNLIIFQFIIGFCLAISALFIVLVLLGMWRGV